MKTIFQKIVAGVAVAALFAFGAASPSQAAGVKTGILSCNVSHGWGFVFGSSRNLHCVFSPISGETEHYTGTVSKFGVDVGYSHGGVMVWQVVAPTVGEHRGALQGSYAGLTASGSFGLGLGAHALVGGFDRSIALQPLSISSERGLNVAAGIGALHLRHAA